MHACGQVTYTLGTRLLLWAQGLISPYGKKGKEKLVVMGKSILCRLPYTQDYLESCNFLEY